MIGVAAKLAKNAIAKKTPAKKKPLAGVRDVLSGKKKFQPLKKAGAKLRSKMGLKK